MTIAVGVAAVLAAAAFGHLVGAVVPSRFAAPLAGGLLALAMNLHERQSGFFREAVFGRLSPWTYLGHGRWGSGPELPADAGYGWAMAFWLASVAGALLAVVGLWRVRSRAAVPGVALAAAVLALGAGAAIRAGADGGWSGEEGGRPHHYAVCVGDPPTVCTHLAYEGLLDRSADVVQAVMAPLVGLPGSPQRADLDQLGVQPMAGSLVVGLLRTGADRERTEWYAQQVALAVVAEEDEAWHGDRFGPAQIAVARWLAREAGFGGDGSEPSRWVRRACSAGGGFGGVVSEAEGGWRNAAATCRALALQAIDLFDQLPAGERRAWLKQHFAELRGGRIGLEDLR